MDKDKAKQIADAHNISKYRKDEYDNIIRQINEKIESEANKGQYKAIVYIEGTYELFEDICDYYNKKGFNVKQFSYGVGWGSDDYVHDMVLNWEY